MKPATTQVQNFLNGWNSSTGAALADLYIFSLVTGEIFYFTDFQTPLAAPLPNTNSPLVRFSIGPRFERTKVKVQIGPQIDELEVAIIAGQNDILGMNAGGTLTWQKASHLGIFDGAYVELLRGFVTITPGIPATFSVVGTITWFYGRVGDIEIGRTRIIMRVKCLLDLLTNQMPQRLFQSACNHIFGGSMCGYNRVLGLNALGVSTGIGQVTITCQAGSDQNSLTTTFVPNPSTSYDNGTMVGLTGLNAGFTRTIGKIDSSMSPSTIFYLKPWIFPVVAGTDQFNLLPGCDHTLVTCVNTFQNQAVDGSTGRYGGFPYIPPPETAV